jgi:hypothetical protein
VGQAIEEEALFTHQGSGRPRVKGERAPRWGEAPRAWPWSGEGMALPAE